MHPEGKTKSQVCMHTMYRPVHSVMNRESEAAHNNRYKDMCSPDNNQCKVKRGNFVCGAIPYLRILCSIM